MRRSSAAVALGFAAGAPAVGSGAAVPEALAAPVRVVRLAPPDVDLVGLTAARGAAVALLDPGTRDGPFVAVRSGGRRVRRLGTVGPGGAEFPMLAADPRGRVVAAWDVPISGGMRYTAQPLPAGPVADLHTGTSPGRLAIAGDGSAVVAHADAAGDVAVTATPGVARPQQASDRHAVPSVTTLTSDAPAVRHLPLGLALRRAGPLVLDLVQRRTRSELRLVGAPTPSGRLAAGRGLREFPSALAATESLIAVAYVSRGRPVLATARPGGTWRRRPLNGSSVSGAPSVAIAGRRAYVAWSQPGAASRRDVRLAVVGRRARHRRLTRSAADDGPPMLAAGPDGEVFAAWASARGAARTPLLARLR